MRLHLNYEARAVVIRSLSGSNDETLMSQIVTKSLYKNLNNSCILRYMGTHLDTPNEILAECDMCSYERSGKAFVKDHLTRAHDRSECAKERLKRMNTQRYPIIFWNLHVAQDVTSILICGISMMRSDSNKNISNHAVLANRNISGD